MRKYIFILKIIIIGLLIIPGVALSDSPEFLKVKQALSTDGSHGTGVAIDSTTKDIIVTGYFSGNAIFDNTKLSSLGQSDIYLTRYDSNGKLLWAKRAGGTGNDKSYGISTDNNGNIIISGMFSGQAFGLTNAGKSDIVVVKFDSDGNMSWANNAGLANEDEAFDVAVDAAGDIYVTGYQQLDPGSGFLNVFLAKLSGTDGTIMWQKTEGGSNEDFGNGIAVDGSGVVVTGRFYDATIIAGTTLTGFGNNDNYDIFIARYAADGTPDWAVQAGGSGNDSGNAITTDSSGNVYATGSFSGSATFGVTQLVGSGASDIYVAGYDSSGALLFAVMAGGNNLIADSGAGKGISMDDSGNILVTGEFSGTATFGTFTLQSAGDTDVFVAKYSTAGNCLSAVSAGGTGADTGADIASVDGNIIVTGSFKDIATFGDKSIATYAGSDMFLSIFGVSSFSQDFSGNGQLGLEDAIGILQIISKLRQ